MKFLLLTLFTIIFLCNNLTAQVKLNTNDLATLKNYMCGGFSSEVQAKKDSDYFDLRLHIRQVWNSKTDGYWLYFEQAAYKYLDKPYRQLVYHLYQINDSVITNQVYEFKKPASAIGAWKDTDPFDKLTTDSIEIKEDCAIYFKKNKQGKFTGSTNGKECSSKLRGAVYATSEIIVSKKLLLIWDRGWDEKDKQVWGTRKEGYHFVKKESYK